MKLRESLLSRRGFITGLIYGSFTSLIAMLGYPAVCFLFHKKEIPLPKSVSVSPGEVEQIALNSAVYFQYGYLPCILLKTETGELRAFSAKCTHLDCTVQYQPSQKKFFCACHEGYFDNTGKNIAGPPPAPLVSLSIHMEGNEIFISHPSKDSGEHKAV
jgi:Rieske Fe-S protein